MSSASPLQRAKITDCSGQNAAVDGIALAMSFAAENGIKLSKLRREVLQLLWERDGPTGAYALIEALEQRRSRPIGPPTVYRALEFLVSNGLAARFESLNAYVPCLRPAKDQGRAFFFCSNCGATAQIDPPDLDKLLTRVATEVDFRPSHKVVEIKGICGECIAEEATGT